MLTFFCPSFQSFIFLLNEFKIGSFEIITGNESIKNFCDKCDIPVIYREEQSDLSVRGFYNYYSRCKNMIEKMEGKRVLFCFHTYDIWSLYQLLTIRKKCEVYFYNIDWVSSPDFEEKDALKIPIAKNPLRHFKNRDYKNRLLKVLVMFFVTGKWFNIFKYDSMNYAPGLTLKRCKKYFLPYQKIKGKNFFKQNQKQLLLKFEQPSMDILIVDSGEQIVHYPESILIFIKDYVAKKKLTVSVKPHPTFQIRFNPDKFNVLEKDFPAELLIGFPRLVIGVASNVLMSYSQHTPVISIFRLLDIEDGSYKQRQWKFISSVKNVQFPASIDELKNSLNHIFN